MHTSKMRYTPLNQTPGPDIKQHGEQHGEAQRIVRNSLMKFMTRFSLFCCCCVRPAIVLRCMLSVYVCLPGDARISRNYSILVW